jgi:hypothetical protein
MLVICTINHPTCTINPSPITVVTPISQLLFHDLISSQIYEFFFKIWKRPLKYALQCNTTHSHSSWLQIYTIFADSVTGWQSVRHGEPKQRDSKYQHTFYSQKISNRYKSTKIKTLLWRHYSVVQDSHMVVPDITIIPTSLRELGCMTTQSHWETHSKKINSFTPIPKLTLLIHLNISPTLNPTLKHITEFRSMTHSSLTKLTNLPTFTTFTELTSPNSHYPPQVLILSQTLPPQTQTYQSFGCRSTTFT